MHAAVNTALQILLNATQMNVLAEVLAETAASSLMSEANWTSRASSSACWCSNIASCIAQKCAHPVPPRLLRPQRRGGRADAQVAESGDRQTGAARRAAGECF